MALAPKLLALTALALALVTASPTPAKADDLDAEAMRLSAAGRSLKWNWTPPSKADRYGHAEVLINAPIATVRTKVQDFGSYTSFAPNKFKSSRVIAKGDGGTTDVYLQFAAMHGMVTLWNVARFSPPRVQGATETVEGRFVRGNVRDANVVWTMRQPEEGWTILKIDILLKPDLPAPQSAVDEELRDAAQNAVDAIHNKAQGNSTFVRFHPGT